MAATRKDKKEARRRRQEDLRARERAIHARLAAQPEAAEVLYVLPSDDEAAPSPLPPPSPSALDEDRVELPALPVGVASHFRAPRRGPKLSWEALKLLVASRHGPSAAALVEEHDGNAADPLFTVSLKMSRRSVPVARHWSQLRAFLSTLADRTRAVDLVPPPIGALGVERIRAARDRRANPDQVAFVACFITGTPLRRRRFGVALSRFGETFHEGRWTPRETHAAGRLSQRLRAALAMGPHAPPPWLYGMQAMRRLPPAYPALRVPGLNAPIPPGAQWGSGEGQWGQPPRNEHNTFLFPGVMDEAAAAEARGVLWGSVPIDATGGGAEAIQTPSRPIAVGGGHAPSTAQTGRPLPTQTAAPITPVPFHPQAYTPQTAMRYVPNTPQEYVRVRDNTTGATVALGAVLVPKKTTPQAPTGNAPPNHQPRPPTKF